MNQMNMIGLWVGGGYDDVNDWGQDPEGSSILDQGGFAERPDLHAWVRNRRVLFEQILEAYAGDGLKAQEQRLGEESKAGQLSQSPTTQDYDYAGTESDEGTDEGLARQGARDARAKASAAIDEDYQSRIAAEDQKLQGDAQDSGAGRSDLQKWIDDDLRPRIAAVNQDFADRYGWNQTASGQLNQSSTGGQYQSGGAVNEPESGSVQRPLSMGTRTTRRPTMPMRQQLLLWTPGSRSARSTMH